MSLNTPVGISHKFPRDPKSRIKKNKVIKTPVWDVKEGLQPWLNRIDPTTGFTGRIATDQLREDIFGTPLWPQDWN